MPDLEMARGRPGLAAGNPGRQERVRIQGIDDSCSKGRLPRLAVD